MSLGRSARSGYRRSNEPLHAAPVLSSLRKLTRCWSALACREFSQPVVPHRAFGEGVQLGAELPVGAPEDDAVEVPGGAELADAVGHGPASCAGAACGHLVGGHRQSAGRDRDLGEESPREVGDEWTRTVALGTIRKWSFGRLRWISSAPGSLLWAVRRRRSEARPVGGRSASATRWSKLYAVIGPGYRGGRTRFDSGLAAGASRFRRPRCLAVRQSGPST